MVNWNSDADWEFYNPIQKQSLGDHYVINLAGLAVVIIHFNVSIGK